MTRRTNPLSTKIVVAGTAALLTVGIAALPQPAAAEYQHLPDSSSETWSYDDTLSTLQDRSDAAARDAADAASAASAADDALSAAKAALSDAQANEQSATTAQNDAKSALDKARTRDEKAKAQRAYNDAVGARHSAMAVTKKATSLVSQRTSAAKIARARVPKLDAVADLAATRVSRLKYLYGSSPSTAFTQLQQSYTFSGSGRPDSGSWSLYDTTRTAKPTARDPKFVNVRDGNLEVSSTGTSGSGACLCTSTSSPAQPYGRFEVRAKVDRNADHGVAILLWPQERIGPESGEIDLAEFDQNRTQANFALHYDAKNLQYQSHILGDYRDWHTYRVDWNERGIAWYIDNNLYATITDPAAIPSKPFQLVIQAGANSSKASNTTTTVSVSSIKVYAP